MVTFIGIKIKDSPQVPSTSSLSLPLWKKFNLVFFKPRVEVGSEIVCHWLLVQFGLCPHLASLASAPGCTLASAVLLYPAPWLESSWSRHLELTFGACVLGTCLGLAQLLGLRGCYGGRTYEQMGEQTHVPVGRGLC